MQTRGANELMPKKKTRKVCIECGCDNIKYDYKHAETYCQHCGLVLIAPPCHGHVFPGLKIIRL